MYNLGLEKGEELEIKLPTSAASQKKQGSSRKTSTTDSVTIAKAFDWIMTKWKILKEMRKPDDFTCLSRNLYAVQKATVRTGHGTIDWFKIGKGIHQSCILSLCLLTCMQSTPCEMPGWMNHKLESKLQGEISTISDMQMIPL